MRLRYSMDSLKDAQTIDIWYERAEPGLKQLFRSDLLLTQVRIIEYPHSGVRTSNSLRRALLTRFPFSVYYRTDATTLDIVAILHHRMELEAWLADR